MNGISLLLLLSSLGATTTVERGTNGQSVYTIRIESLLINEMRNGQSIPVVVAARDRGIRHFKIAVTPEGNSRTNSSRNLSDFNSRAGDLFDYEPVQLENGEIEYVVQISPERLESLAAGKPIEGDVAANVPAVDRYLIFVGVNQLPSQQQNVKGSNSSNVPLLTGYENNLVQAGGTGSQSRFGAPPQSSQFQATAQPTATRNDPLTSQFNTRSTDSRSWRNNPDQSTPQPPPFATTLQQPTVNNSLPRSGAVPTIDRNVYPAQPTYNQYQPQQQTYNDPNAGYVPQNQATFPQNYTTNPQGGYQQPVTTIAARADAPNAALPAAAPPAQNWNQPIANTQVVPSQVVPAPATTTAGVAATKPPEEPKSSWPLVLTSLALFASIGFNLWLGWLAWSFFWRYREAVTESARVRSHQSSIRQAA
jgi:hypothetical protein